MTPIEEEQNDLCVSIVNARCGRREIIEMIPNYMWTAAR